MAKSRPPYAEEFRRRLIELVRSGRTPEELAEKFEPTAQSIRNWAAHGDEVDDGEDDHGSSRGRRPGGPAPDRRHRGPGTGVERHRPCGFT